MTRLAAALAALAAATAAHALTPLPRNLVVVPVYSTPPGVRLSWFERGGVEYYTIRRAVDGGPEKALATIAGGPLDNRVSYLDTELVATSTYTYRVEVCDGVVCVFSERFTTSPRVVWPIVGEHEVMHGYNEVLAWAGPAGLEDGYHMGVDLNKTTPATASEGNVVVAPRGGIVIDVRITGVEVDNGAIGVVVNMGDGRFEVDGFNHIATTGANAPPVGVNDIVAPGQPIARIGTMNGFVGNFGKHTHFLIEHPSPRPTGHQRPVRHPLLIFSDPTEQDPFGNPPTLVDENQDGKVVLFRDHATGTEIKYDFATTPLRGDVDVEPEVVDQQGTDPHPRQAPIDLGYWIEGPLPDAEQLDDVKSGAHPYRLYDFRVEYFGGTPGVSDIPAVPCDVVSDIRDVANAGCGGLKNCSENPGVVCNSVLKEGTTSWVFPVLHHFIVTHAKGEAGTRADVDPNQFWRTAAKDDGAPAGSTHANYAGQPTTTKAWEARFPDGDYVIHVVASDLVHDKVDLPIRDHRAPPGPAPGIRLENFAPFVKEVMFARDLDNNPASGLPGFPGCELLARHYRHTHRQPPLRPEDVLVATGIEQMARSGHKVCVKVRFSEPVANVMVDLVTKRGAGDPIAGSAFTGAASQTHQDNDTWIGTLVVPADPTGASDGSIGSDENDVALRIRAVDRRDAAGNTRTVDGNGDGVPDQGDLNHVALRLDTSPPAATIDVVKP